MKKIILFAVASAIGLFAILFWIAFVVISYRNESYVFEVEIDDKKDSYLFFEYDGIKYYSYNGFKDVNVYDKRFIFNTNKRSIKSIIKNDKMDSLVSEMVEYSYDYGGVFETKYRDKLEDESFCITRCDFFVDEKIVYIFSDKAYLNICRWFK